MINIAKNNKCPGTYLDWATLIQENLVWLEMVLEDTLPQGDFDVHDIMTFMIHCIKMAPE